MKLDLQSLFRLRVHSCTLWLRPPPPPRLGSYEKALLVSQDRRHLFVTPLGQYEESLALASRITCQRDLRDLLFVKIIFWKRLALYFCRLLYLHPPLCLSLHKHDILYLLRQKVVSLP